MAIKDCFDKFGDKKLTEKFQKLVDGGTNPLVAARNVIIEESDALFERANKIRKAIGVPAKKQKQQKQIDETLFPPTQPIEGGGETIELTPEQKEKHNAQASNLGWDNAPQAINSINKRLGTNYKGWEEIPKYVKEFVSSFRNAVEKQKTEFNVALKAAYKYLDMAVKDGTITREQADELANMAAERQTPKTEKKGTLAEGVSTATKVNQAKLKEKKVTALQNMKDMFTQFFRGERKGKIDFKKMQDAFTAQAEGYVKSLGINMSDLSPRTASSLTKRMNNINSASQLINFMEYADKVANNKEFADKADKANKLIKAIQGLSKAKLTNSDKRFIESFNWMNPKNVSDIDGYIQVLDTYLKTKRGAEKASPMSQEALNDFVTKEYAYYQSKMQEIESLKQMIAEIDLYEHAQKMVENSGETITIEEAIAAIQNRDNATAEMLELMRNVDKEMAERIMSMRERENISVKSLIKGMGTELARIFSDNNKKAKYEVLRRWANSNENTTLTRDKAILLNNILNNIYDYENFEHIDVIVDELMQAEATNLLADNFVKEQFRNLKKISFEFRMLLGLKPKDNVERTTRDKSLRLTFETIASSAKKMQSAFIANAVIGKLGDKVSVAQTKWKTIVNNFYNEVVKPLKEDFNKLTMIDDIGFINQWVSDWTQEEINEHFQMRYTKRALDAKNIYEKGMENLNSGDDNIKSRKGRASLQNLYELGFITEPKYSTDKKTVEFDVIEGLTPSDLESKLNAPQMADIKQAYEKVLSFYAALTPAVKNNVINATTNQWDNWNNYYATFTDNLGGRSIDDAMNTGYLGSFNILPKASGNAKQRSTQILGSNRTYSIGLTENFERGIWESLLIADTQNERNFTIAAIRDGSPLEKVIGTDNMRLLRDQVIQVLSNDFAFGRRASYRENDLMEELGNLTTSQTVNWLLREPSQILKQSTGIFATIYKYPKASKILLKYLWQNVRNSSRRIKTVTDQTELASRTAIDKFHYSVGKTPIENYEGTHKLLASGLRRFERFSDWVSDGVTPIYNIFRGILNKKRGKSFGEGARLSMLSATDIGVSQFAYMTAYVDAMMKLDNLSKNQVFDKLDRLFDGIETPSDIAHQSALQHQESVNAPNLASQKPEQLKNRNVTFFMKSFSFILHKYAMDAANKAIDKSIPANERRAYAVSASTYLMQSIMFRAVSLSIQNAILEEALEFVNLVDDDDDEDNKLLLEEFGSDMFFGVLSDAIVGSKSVYYDIALAFVSNKVWDAVLKDYFLTNEAKEDITAITNKPSKELVRTPSLGGSAQVFADFLYKKTANIIKNKDVIDAGFVDISLLSPTALGGLSLALGSGTGRRLFSKDERDANAQMQLATTLYGEGVEDKDIYKEVFNFLDSKKINENLSLYIQVEKNAKTGEGIVKVYDKDAVKSAYLNAQKEAAGNVAGQSLDTQMKNYPKEFREAFNKLRNDYGASIELTFNLNE